MATKVIYHAHCFDGFCAAWVAGHALKERDLQEDPLAIPRTVEFIPASYGDKEPEIGIGDEVYIVDFSYPKDVLRGMNFLAHKLVVLDHHKTAQANLEGLDYCIFDMNKSGAGLTWDYFHPNEKRPALVDYMEDRDLWKFNLSMSKEIFAWVASWPMDFTGWDNLNTGLSTNEGFQEAVEAGHAILRAHNQKVATICEEVMFVDFGGDMVKDRWPDIPTVNCPYSFGSDCGQKLLEMFPKAPFAAYYLVKGNGEQQWGLRGRSTDDFDVSEVAKLYGGGGHKKASGFIKDRITREVTTIDGKFRQ